MPYLLDRALVAALFYSFAYAALLRILVYPRNWLLPPKEGLVTVTFAALVAVLYTAMTPSGFSLWYAGLAVALLAALAFCIAAPALSFKPGFAGVLLRALAHHGSFAGVLVASAFATLGVCLESSAFQGLAIAALGFELLWAGTCLRDWRGRINVALEPHDVAVLNAQAGSDVAAFVRRNRLFALRPGASSGPYWRGCTQDTQPCAFNHHSAQLGLNAAPCCRQHLRQMCIALVSELQHTGHVCWLDGGTLLGATRDGDVLAWEDDIDLGVLLDDDSSWVQFTAAAATSCRRLGFHLERFDGHGFLTASFDAPRPWPLSLTRNRMRGELRVDLVTYRKQQVGAMPYLCRMTPKGAMPAIGKAGFGLPADVVLPLATVSFAGHVLPAPAQTGAYLQTLYGHWREVRFLYMDPAAARRRAHLSAAGQAAAGRASA